MLELKKAHEFLNTQIVEAKWEEREVSMMG